MELGEALIFSTIFMGEQGKITFSGNSSYSWLVRPIPQFMDGFRARVSCFRVNKT